MKNTIKDLIAESKKEVKKIISVTLEPAVWKEAKKLSKELGVSFSLIVNLSLKILINTNANEIEKAKLNNKGK